MFCRAWSGPKPGHAAGQNQDAYEVRRLRDTSTGDAVLLTISDGASSTVHAGPWARALVSAAELDWPSLDDETLTARLDAARKRFPLDQPDDLPWYISHKLAREGSQAALLVASLMPAPGTREILLRTVAVGDCTLIVFRRDGSVESFPVSASTDFGFSPRLISTKPQPGLQYDRWAGSVEPGDVLVACTDALGRWMLETVEAADTGSFFSLLLNVLDSDSAPELSMPPAGDDFFRLLTESAGQRRLREDDVTLILCVPMRSGNARTAHEFARATLKGHLSGDVERLFQAPPAWQAWALAVVGRVRRAIGRG
jgi:hypothetical protein